MEGKCSIDYELQIVAILLPGSLILSKLCNLAKPKLFFLICEIGAIVHRVLSGFVGKTNRINLILASDMTEKTAKCADPSCCQLSPTGLMITKISRSKLVSRDLEIYNSNPFRFPFPHS